MTVFNLAIELAYCQQTVIRSILGLVAVLLPAGTLVYLYLFKMMSFMQSRLGPMEAGLLHDIGYVCRKSGSLAKW